VSTISRYYVTPQPLLSHRSGVIETSQIRRPNTENCAPEECHLMLSNNADG